MRQLVLALIAAILTSGCGLSLPANPTKMTAEQLREWVKDKSGAIQCATVATPYKGTAVSVNLDKGVILNGTLTLKDGCEVTITNTQGVAPK